MSKAAASLIAIGWALLTPAFGQLYLIAGSPTPDNDTGYAMVLFAVGADGSTRISQQIVPSKFGTQWIATSYDYRNAVILSKAPDSSVIVIDLDTATVSKSCKDPDGTFLGVGSRWLIKSPSHGLMFVGYGASTLTKKERLLGMMLDGGVACSESFIEIENHELRDFIGDGSAGIADVESFDAMYAVLGSDGSLSNRLLTGDSTYFDYKVPTSFFSGMKSPAASILINNREILGLLLTDPPNARLMVFRKTDGSWHQVPDASRGRAFGSFIGSSENHTKSERMPESAGRVEWRPGEAATGPSMVAILSRYRGVYPGILHLYDAATERAYTLITDQGDSEILLVENSTVYYRVTNRLYSPAIEGTSIGAAKLLATDDLIEDAHWAFIKR